MRGVADPQLQAEVMAIDRTPPVAELEIVIGDRPRQVAAGDGAVLDRLADALTGRDVDPGGLADQEQARPGDLGAGLEAALGELLDPVAGDVESASGEVGGQPATRLAPTIRADAE